MTLLQQKCIKKTKKIINKKNGSALKQMKALREKFQKIVALILQKFVKLLRKNAQILLKVTQTDHNLLLNS